MSTSYSFIEAIRYVLRFLKKYWKTSTLFIVLFSVPAFFRTYIYDLWMEGPDNQFFGYAGVVLFSSILNGFITYYAVSLIFDKSDQFPTSDNLLPNFTEATIFVGAYLLYSLMVCIGLILLVVPGIYFGVRYIFFYYTFHDNSPGIWNSFHKSGELVEGNWWAIFLAVVAFAVFSTAVSLPNYYLDIDLLVALTSGVVTITGYLFFFDLFRQLKLQTD